MGISKQGGHTGYLMIDHRNSPGVPDEMVRDFMRKTGRAVVTAGEGQLFEADTFRCPHCHKLVLKNPLRVSERHVCRRCMQVTCDTPGCLVDCIPLAHVMDMAERNPETVVEAIANLRRDILG